MTFDWQTIINLVLFAMLVVAFTFAIWSYVKTNNIKNNNPSVPIGNNTYINNIASAPNLVAYDTNATTSYALKSTDNGTTFLLTGDNADTAIFTFNTTPESYGVRDKNNNLIKGYYIKVTNATVSATIGVASSPYNGEAGGPVISRFNLPPGVSAHYFQAISTAIDGVAPDQLWILH